MKIFKRIIRFIAKCFMWFFIITIGLTVIYKFVPVPVTPLMLIRVGEQAVDKDKDVRLYKDWVSMSSISRHMPQAVYAAEDQKFMDHRGFDTEAMKKAWENNKKGKRIKGASTISQQTSKNVFLWPGRNLIRKGLEAYFTVLIEFIWGKERIMEVYLNVIEMGEGIYGVEAAAQHYFKKSAAQLSRQEAALIAATLPNPRRWSPAKPTAYIYGRQAWILIQMRNLKQLDYGTK
ncbi:monofunctional biosynthetic peptidoglycan transglycosylase [Belliella kenyensis]|uniref:Biosynthetic peptidoglycan transglycosylase n=1 Tax=Belliella kenyensis TaxID=1472724 RepID=A0ABV8EQP7_9BACT|nr:monofunctional biosynthetic peptidoglycan transglycosylase [Belliella kenyensis]MCH7401622.1 monofunctional biosynthetic peptidoglycan transglycosylase [Belliella kenyensis]MDN3603099.1 monofunctional biosynthetic peptidoglycan transglycosylase [Belliella kenyensis]